MQKLPTSGDWAVCHSRPRCEKKLALFCQTHEVGAFLPVLVSKKEYGTRTRTHTRPLFPGYLFVRGNINQLQSIQQNQHCANLLKIENQHDFQHQLEAVNQALDMQKALDVVPFIEEGREVRVILGPFKGTIGLISEVHGQNHIIINFDMIQQSVALKVDWSMLEPTC